MSTATEEPSPAGPAPSPAGGRRRRTAVRAMAVLVAPRSGAFVVFAALVDLPGGPLDDERARAWGKRG